MTCTEYNYMLNQPESPAIRAETNTANTRVLIKDFGTRIVKLDLLRSYDPAHTTHLPSRSDTIKKAIEFDNTMCIIVVT